MTRTAVTSKVRLGSFYTTPPEPFYVWRCSLSITGTRRTGRCDSRAGALRDASCSDVVVIKECKGEVTAATFVFSLLSAQASTRKTLQGHA